MDRPACDYRLSYDQWITALEHSFIANVFCDECWPCWL